MRYLLSLFIFIISVLSLNIANAEDVSDDSSDEEQIIALQQTLAKLQTQVEYLKKTSDSDYTNQTKSFETYSSKVAKPGEAGKNPDIVAIGGEDRGAGAPDLALVGNKELSIQDLAYYSDNSLTNERGGIDVGGAVPITSQGEVSFLGAYSGNNSIPIGQISSNLFASTLIGQRQKFDDYSIFFGGYIEADAQAWMGSEITTINKKNRAADGQNIYLTASKLYFLSNLGHYVTAQFDFDTDESSNFSVGNAFVIFGNLDTSPYFVTAGKSKLSVGSFGGGGPWSNGITKALFSPKYITNVSLNYKDSTSNFNIAVFGSDDQTADFSAAYFYAAPINEIFSIGLNAGYIFDAKGAGNRNFLVAGDHSRIGLVNTDVNLSISNILPGLFQIGAGWAQTTNANQAFNGVTSAYAGAWTTQVNYAQVLAGRSTNFGLSYGQSYNANNIPMSLSSPAMGASKTAYGIQNQFIASAQRAYFDNNVLFGPEYAYQRLYNNQHMNTVTLDMSVYV